MRTNKTHRKLTLFNNLFIFFTAEELQALPMVGLLDLYYFYDALSRLRFSYWMIEKFNTQIELLNAELTKRDDEYWEQYLLIEDVMWYEDRAKAAAKAEWDKYMSDDYKGL